MAVSGTLVPAGGRDDDDPPFLFLLVRLAGGTTADSSFPRPRFVSLEATSEVNASMEDMSKTFL
jgi:hypothetical protein